jgi:hypothetical protein
MNKYHLKLNLTVLLLLMSVSLQAGFRSAAFTKLGVSSREIAMGRCGVSTASNASAVYWNPANMLQFDQEKHTLGLISSGLGQSAWDAMYGSVFTGYAFRKFAIGAGALYYQVNEIEAWDDQMNYLGNFNNMEIAGLGAMAIRLSNVINIGATVWGHQQSFSNDLEDPRLAIGGQAGLSYYPFPKARSVKFSLNLIDERGFFSVTDSSEMIFSPGISGIIPAPGRRTFLGKSALAIELEQRRHTPLQLKFGIENEWRPALGISLFTRLGMDDIVLEYANWGLDKNAWGVESISQDDYAKIQRKYTFGFGIKYQPLRLGFDYAVVLEHYRTLHFFSLNLWP